MNVQDFTMMTVKWEVEWMQWWRGEVKNGPTNRRKWMKKWSDDNISKRNDVNEIQIGEGENRYKFALMTKQYKCDNVEEYKEGNNDYVNQIYNVLKFPSIMWITWLIRSKEEKNIVNCFHSYKEIGSKICIDCREKSLWLLFRCNTFKKVNKGSASNTLQLED